MNIHERIEAFWAGERPDQIPFTIYQNEWRHTQDDPAWEAMYKAGLGVTWHISPFRTEGKNAEYDHTTEEKNGVIVSRQVIKTPLGDIWQTWTNGWQDKFLLKTAADYRVMTEIIRNTTVIPHYESVARTFKKIMPHGVGMLSIGRTPLQTILVDYAGIENFSLHLVDFEEEVRELYNALLQLFRQKVEITAKAPGRFVSNLENFTAESLGPQRFEEFLLPVYQECFPVMQDTGKIVGCHYDGLSLIHI